MSVVSISSPNSLKQRKKNVCRCTLICIYTWHDRTEKSWEGWIAANLYDFHFLPQVKQEKLEEDHTAVNKTLDLARGFISETETTVADVDALVQVRPTLVCWPRDGFMSWGSVVKMERSLGPTVSLWLGKWGSMYHNLIDCDMELRYLRACIKFIHEIDSWDKPVSDSKAGKLDSEAICRLPEIE